MRRDNFDLGRCLRDIHRYLEKGYVVCYTDGSYNVKNGVGGYGVYLKCGVVERRLSVGPIMNTDIVRMEMFGIWEALNMANKGKRVVIFCDSQRAINLAMGWAKVKDNDKKELVLWIKKEMNKFKVCPKVRWIPSHLDIDGSRHADRLAEEGRKIWRHSKRKG